MFMSPTYRITGLHHTYGCTTFSTAYVGYLFFWNHWVSLVLWVSSLKFSLLLLGVLTESVDHIRLIGARLNDAPP